METHKLKLNKENLHKYCGQNCDFQILCVAVELRDNKLQRICQKILEMKYKWKRCQAENTAHKTKMEVVKNHYVPLIFTQF